MPILHPPPKNKNQVFLKIAGLEGSDPLSYLKIKLNGSFFSAPYAIGSENSVLEPDLAARYRGRGESCPLGLGLASSPRTLLPPPTGPRFEAGERSTGPVMGTA